MKDPIKLSIITINRNNEYGLKETIESVLNQKNINCEYIVIDGNSSDNSVEVIKQNANNITYWISEPDQGIYDAMNKGIMKAEGEYILFLNSGDTLASANILEEVYIELCDYDLIYGDYLFKDGSFKIFPDFLTPFTFYKSSLGHQASFFKRSIFNDYGMYRTEFKIVGDWEFYIRAIIFGNATYKHASKFIAVFDLNNQYTINTKLNQEEKDKVFREYYGPFIADMEALKELTEIIRQYQKPLLYKIKKMFANFIKIIF
jgi:glycosyltransferase involved in cell wall biosynthesis